jgi:hypothetical protein
MVASDFSRERCGLAIAEASIEAEIAAINQGGRVRIRWLREGAAGADKALLFQEADVFVLPTYYAVEAQPLVLLEAMAAGCAIITTRAGEIPTILDEECALFVEAPATESLVAAMLMLIEDDTRRARLACAAHTRFVERYQISRHLDAWENILASASDPGSAGRTRHDPAG